MFSTNGTKHFPDDLKPFLKGSIQQADPPGTLEKTMQSCGLADQYDAQLSYTALQNFSHYFRRGSSNRFGIWNYETTILPKAFPKFHQYVDMVLPSSQFSKDIFTTNGMPADKQVIVPHGIHLDRFAKPNKYSLKTKKRYKILANIAQPHLRKNIPGLLRAYGKAFTSSDDVCLVLKVSRKSPQPGFDVPFTEVFERWKKDFKQHGEVEIIDQFLTDIEPLYNACDIVFTMSMAECFWMPGLEALGAGKVVVAPRYGGQLDFLNDQNAILIGGKKIRAPLKMQYWEPSIYAEAFEPDIDEASLKLKDLVANYGDYHKKFLPEIKATAERFTWENASRQILGLCK